MSFFCIFFLFIYFFQFALIHQLFCLFIYFFFFFLQFTSHFTNLMNIPHLAAVSTLQYFMTPIMRRFAQTFELLITCLLEGIRLGVEVVNCIAQAFKETRRCFQVSSISNTALNESGVK